MKTTLEKRNGLLSKTVEVSRIRYNESDSSRITREFEVAKVNRKLRKTTEYFQNFKGNNFLDPAIILREIRTEKDFYFVCLEGAIRIWAMKQNEKIRYLKCKVQNALKGINEIKGVGKRIELKEVRTKPVVLRFDNIKQEVKQKYAGKPMMARSRLPTVIRK